MRRDDEDEADKQGDVDVVDAVDDEHDEAAVAEPPVPIAEHNSIEFDDDLDIYVLLLLLLPLPLADCGNELLVQTDDVDEPDEDNADVQSLKPGNTMSSSVTVLFCCSLPSASPPLLHGALDVLTLVTSGESSMNANVFFSSSKVNEQLESLGVCGS